ncbi:A disintegrin and metalloproteinase with thrombospondin motifs 18 [Elysia marginata]|uniref:A disintegrin and metalloproteinase with thrombospondin motifs 18 n=1 Tax=Elysia marginata TaxID=1093978 RepID=A0AAV4JLH4_9GAST|nr:A disintegrin and metalloproteinase with thrombospondin motifs 18 [Elysia marginata]
MAPCGISIPRLLIRLKVERPVVFLLICSLLGPPFVCEGTHMENADEAVNVKVEATDIRSGSPAPDVVDPMPEEINSVLETHHGKIHLRLKQHHCTSAPHSHKASTRTSARWYGDCSIRDIPVYTRLNTKYTGKENFTHPSRTIRLDEFPRVYLKHSRTYKDDTQRAIFLVVHNAASNSFKMFGSVRIGGEQYTIQPSTIDELNAATNRSTGREEPSDNNTHLLEKASAFDFSSDHMGLFLKAKPPLGNAFATREQPTKSSTSFVQVRVSTTTIYPSSTTAQHGSVDIDANGYRAFIDISMHSSGNTSNSLKTEVQAKNKIDYISSNDTAFKLHEEGLYDLAEILRRQRKYWYHNSFEHIYKPTLPTPTTTTEEPTNPTNEMVVEVFFVCDFLCYQKFQAQYKVTDPVATKNAIAQYFTYVRDFHETAYGSLLEDYPELGLDVEVRVVGLYIATHSSHKVIGDYVIGDNKEVDSVPSLFEFVLWVEDTLKHQIKADYYVLVTGYDLSGESNFILGLVSNIPSVCQLDSVSMAELWLPITASVMAHELGHSLGADHDGLTNGFCQDEQQFIMAASVGGPVPEKNVGNNYRLR